MTNMLLMILFAPDTYVWALMVLMTVVSVLAFLGCRRLRRKSWRWAILLAVLFLWYVLLYGTFVEPRHLSVRQVEFASADLPPAFDGYRIVQFSDAHVGSFTGWRTSMLSTVVDSINAQGADLIVFTGDLQNKHPSEIEPHVATLSRLKAKDGVYSVLGNHDYAMYVDADPYQQMMNLEATIAHQSEAGWTVLANSHVLLRRGDQSIVLAGMENDGEGRFPQLGNINKSLFGLNRESFVVMLEHDPTAWRRKILPHSHCQLTLSGHTHGGQLSLLGLSPAMLRFRESAGMYYIGQRAISVSSGIGGVVPIRFGATPEIVVITLKSK